MVTDTLRRNLRLQGQKYVSLVFLSLMLGCTAVQSRADEVCFKQTCFQVEVASTPDERRRGLQRRREMAPDAGMLFIFPQSRPYRFWMKDTLIPLDMIWLDENGRVVDIRTAVPCQADPCPTYAPQGAAKYVLELNAGVAEAVGMKIGGKLDLNLK